jgi:hypothetical protein
VRVWFTHGKWPACIWIFGRPEPLIDAQVRRKDFDDEAGVERSVATDSINGSNRRMRLQ